MQLLKPGEVADQLKVATVTIYKWAERGVLPCVRIEGVIRFVPEDVARLIRERRSGSKETT